VEWQLNAAAGQVLPVKQEDINLRGWSFEARIYAEDPNNSFMPGAGPLDYLATPEAGEDVRIETGVRQGDQVSVHYDPMIAKLVVWGEDRDSALRKLRACLSEYNIQGLSTNVNFLMDLSFHPEFVAGNVDTEFIPRHYDSLFPEKKISDISLCQAVVAGVLSDNKSPQNTLDLNSPFAHLTGARFNHHLQKTVNLIHDGKNMSAFVTCLGGNSINVKINDNTYSVNAKLCHNPQRNFTELVTDIDGDISKQRVVVDGDSITLYTKEGSQEFSKPVPKHRNMGGAGGGLGDTVAPMPGVIEKVMVEDGAVVEAGDPLVVMIAMKMEYVIKAPKAGTVKKVNTKLGDFVEKGKVLVSFAEEE